MMRLEERLRIAGRSHADPTPDLDTIKNRGRTIRRTRQVGAAVASVALVAVGGVAAFSALRPEGDTTVVAATDGVLDHEDIPDQTSPPDSIDDDSGERADESADAVEVTSTTSPQQTEQTGDDNGDGIGDGEAGTDDVVARPSSTSVFDGTGGWLTATQAGVEHLRADGTIGVVTFAEPPGGFAQRWPTDVVLIDGDFYLLVDQFVNRQDLEAERVRALAQQYDVAYDQELGALGLEDVATPRELDSLNHWEVAILAVDLATDEVITVENRTINSTHSPEWFYNGHITSDGSNIMVMRELWQGHCLYADGLTLGGAPVDIVDTRIYAKPAGLDDMTYDDIDAVMSLEADPPQPCRTLAELPDSGLGVWGTHADTAQIEAFRIAFSEAGLG